MFNQLCSLVYGYVALSALKARKEEENVAAAIAMAAEEASSASEGQYPAAKRKRFL